MATLMERTRRDADRLLELVTGKRLGTGARLTTFLPGGHMVGVFPLVAACRAGKPVDPMDLALKAVRQNSPVLLQVGDTVGAGRVESITVGRSYDTAKNGNPVRSVAGDMLRSADTAERVIVGFVDARGNGYWRRGTQLGGWPAPDRHSEKKDLRELHRQAKACLRESWRRREAGIETGEQVLLAGRIVTAIGHELSLASGSVPGPRAYLRRRIRDIDAALERDRPDLRTRAFDLAFELRREKAECVESLRRIRREATAERTPAPMP